MSLRIADYFITTIDELRNGQIYALLLDESGNGLKRITYSPDMWELNTYEKVSHNQFCITLSEHAEITYYGYIEIPDDELNLINTPVGEQYIIEFWQGNSIYGYPYFDRDIDTLIGYNYITWRNGYKVFSDLTLESAMDVLNYKIRSSVVYNQTTEILKILAWLDVNGKPNENVTNMQITLMDSAGSTMFSFNISTFIPNLDGIFSYDYEIDLPADEIYIAEIIITDENGDEHKGYDDIVSLD